MSKLAAYREKQIWKKLLNQLAELNRRHTLAHARQVHREAMRLRLRTRQPEAIAELNRFSAQLEAKILEDWRTYLATPGVAGQEIEVELFDFPQPLLSYAFKFPNDFGSEEWRQAVEGVQGIREAKYAAYFLECKLIDKDAALSLEDRKHIREAIRSMMHSAKRHEAEEIRRRREAVDESYAKYEAAQEELKKRSGGESALQSQAVPRQEGQEMQLNSWPPRRNLGPVNSKKLEPFSRAFARRIAAVKPEWGRIASLDEHSVEGLTVYTLVLEFPSENPSVPESLKLSVELDRIIYWGWFRHGGGVFWHLDNVKFFGDPGADYNTDSSGFDHVISSIESLLTEEIVVIEAVDNSGGTFGTAKAADIASGIFKRGSEATIITSWRGTYDQTLGPEGS